MVGGGTQRGNGGSREVRALGKGGGKVFSPRKPRDRASRDEVEFDGERSRRLSDRAANPVSANRGSGARSSAVVEQLFGWGEGGERSA